jgi:MerR family mercuric resistance operon transcriptional regulator
MSNELTIGKLATAAGVNVETIRYYQRRGLLTEPVRPAGGQRRYSPNDARRVLGFTLEEVGSLLTLEEASACAETQELAAHKLRVIDQKLADLEAMRSALAGLLRKCQRGSSTGGCPIIQVLDSD